eukprot:scpid14148/ scgid33378/ VWFA and cache domain-containing protein 1
MTCHRAVITLWSLLATWMCCRTSAQTLTTFSSAALQSKLSEFSSSALGAPSMQSAFDAAVVSSTSSIDGVRAVSTLATGVSTRLTSRSRAARDLQSAARQAYQAGMTRQEETLCCKLDDDDVAFDSRFNTTVSRNNGCDRISATASSNRPMISAAIAAASKANLVDVPELKFQYYGSEEGYATIYPGFNASSCSSYDPRYRPWYVAAAVPAAKDVVIVVDTSGSMGAIIPDDNRRTRLDLAKEAIDSILGILSPEDRVTILPFNTNPDKIEPNVYGNMSCFNTIVGPATPYNIRQLKWLVQELNAGGATNYAPAISKAYQIFSASPALASRDRVILFLSDGDPGDSESEILSKQESAALPFNYRIHVLTYAMGANIEAGRGILTKMANQDYPGVSATKATGEFRLVSDFLNLRPTLTRFYSFFASEDTSSSVIFTQPYYDAFGLGLIMTAAAPVYTTNSDTTQVLRGVVGVDITITDLFADISYFSDDEHQYAFMINRKGAAILHPLLNQPVDISSDPLFQDITLLEVDAQFRTLVYSQMRNGTTGSATINATRFLTIGDSKYEGTVRVSVLSTYYWTPVYGTDFVVCVVLNLESSREVADIGSQNAPSESTVYHRLDLAAPRGRRCDQFGREAVSDVSAVKFSPEAFTDPARYLNVPESTSNVTQMLNYLDGRSVTNRYFKSSVVNLVRLTSKLDKIWDSNFFRKYQQSVVWRYIGAIDGVFRIIPGTQLPTSYDHLSRGWFTRSLNRPGQLTMSPPYLDAFGAGYVVTLSTTIHQSSVRSNPSAVGAVMAMDFAVGFLNEFMISVYGSCANSYRCMLLDSSGYLVFHPSFLSASANPEWVHLGHEEPQVMETLLNTGVLRKKSCVRYDTFSRYSYFRVTMPTGQTEVSSSYPCQDPVAHGTSVNFKVMHIANTNMYLAVVSTSCPYRPRTLSSCPCPVRNGLGQCQTSEILQSCECPCVRGVDYFPCNNSFPGSIAVSDVCPAEIVALPVVPRKPDKVTKLEKCFNGRCSNITSSRTCQATVGCAWCTQDKDDTELSSAYCTTDCACFQGVQGKENPNAACTEANDDNQAHATWNAGYSAAIVVITLIIVFSVIRADKRKRQRRQAQQQARSGGVAASQPRSTPQRASTSNRSTAALVPTPPAPVMDKTAAFGTTSVRRPSAPPDPESIPVTAYRPPSDPSAPPDYNSALTMSTSLNTPAMPPAYPPGHSG